MTNPFRWPVVKGKIVCPECGAPTVEQQVPGAAGPRAAYTIRCTKCWKAQCTDPSSTRWK